MYQKALCISGKVTVVSSDSSDVDDPSATATGAAAGAAAAPTPRQDALKLEISIMQDEVDALVRKRDANLGDSDIEKKIRKLRDAVDEKKKVLNSKIVRAKIMRKFRAKQKTEILKLTAACKGMPTSLLRANSGRPSLNETQPGLLQAICDMAMHGSSAADRRRSETLRSCKTLDQLHEGLTVLGFELSRSSTYRRLIPRKWGSIEGRHHVTTVPVKLCRAQADRHRDHQDQYFCRASISGLEEVASVLGPEQVPEKENMCF